LRATAAEARLALLSGKGKAKDEAKEEEDELEPTDLEDDTKPDLKPDLKPDVDDLESEEGSDNEVIEIADPHLSAEDRRHEMESEMTADERAGLRCDWHEFMVQANAAARASASRSASPVKSPGKSESASASKSASARASRTASPTKIKSDSDSDDDIVFLGDANDADDTVKRKAEVPSERKVAKKLKRPPPSSSPGPSLVPSPKSKPTLAPAPTFDHASLVRRERLRALGLDTSSSRALGSGRSGSAGPSGMARSARQEWACSRCTFINDANHARCSK
jgi:hypothetical protein